MNSEVLGVFRDACEAPPAATVPIPVAKSAGVEVVQHAVKDNMRNSSEMQEAFVAEGLRAGQAIPNSIGLNGTAMSGGVVDPLVVDALLNLLPHRIAWLVVHRLEEKAGLFCNVLEVADEC